MDKLYEQKYGTEQMLNAAVEGRLKKNQPVLFYQYTPHTMFVNYPIGEAVVTLEDPKDWWTEVVNVYKFGNKDWIANNPKASKLLRKIEMTAADIGWMMAQSKEKGDDDATLTNLARDWMSRHKADVDSWLEAIK